MRTFLLFGLVLLSISSVRCATAAEETLEQALQSADPALRKNANFYYNLGVSQFRSQHFDTSVALFEVALALRPFDSGAKEALALAQSEWKKTRGNSPLDPASNAAERFLEEWTRSPYSLLVQILLAVALFLWVKRFFQVRSWRALLPEGKTWVALILLTFHIFILICAWVADPAAVFLRQTTLRSGPAETFTDLGFLPAGTKIRVVGESEQWLQIRMNSSQIAWVPNASVLLLSSPWSKSKE